jgi:hypothetical protein
MCQQSKTRPPHTRRQISPASSGLASPDRLAEDVLVSPIVVVELKLRDVEREIFVRHPESLIMLVSTMPATLRAIKLAAATPG